MLKDKNSINLCIIKVAKSLDIKSVDQVQYQDSSVYIHDSAYRRCSFMLLLHHLVQCLPLVVRTAASSERSSKCQSVHTVHAPAE